MSRIRAAVLALLGAGGLAWACGGQPIQQGSWDPEFVGPGPAAPPIYVVREPGDPEQTYQMTRPWTDPPSRIDWPWTYPWASSPEG
jgi:hypothetical protein